MQKLKLKVGCHHNKNLKYLVEAYQSMVGDKVICT